MTTLQLLWAGAWLLLGAGMYGMMTGRNLLKLMISLQLMVKGALLLIVTAGTLSGRMELGMSLAVTIVAVDTLTTVIGLALVVQVKSQIGTLNMDNMTITGE